MGKVIDVRERLVQARRLLDGQSPALDPMFSRALYSMLLAFGKYAEFDGDELAQLVEIAQNADSIDQGAVEVLEAIKDRSRAPFKTG
jgi:hypothetical protein